MKYINNYLTKAAYVADSNRPTNKSTASNIDDGTGVVYDGKNILVDKAGAGIGDIAVYNTSVSAVQFIKFGTYNAATLPASITILGVVYYRTENRVNIVSKNNQASARWAAGYKAKLSGFDFISGGSFTITINSTTTAAITYTNSDTLITVATAIAAALTNSGFTSAIGWTVAADNTNNCISVVRNWSSPIISSFSITDASLKVTASVVTPKDYQCTLSGLITAYGSITRNNGTSLWYAGANYAKFYNYYHDNGSASINQVVGGNDPVKYAVFDATNNPALVSYYGAGETGYAAYISDMMLKYPASKNAIIDENGQTNTNLLAAVSYNDIGGIAAPAYPAANNAKTFGIIVGGYTTGFEAGAWWLPACREMYLLIKNALLDNSDAVNRSLTAIGGDKVLASGYYPWTSTGYSSNIAWFYYGNGGGMYYSYKYSAYNVRPVTAF